MTTKVATHSITEIFPAIQGEGSLAGTPSTFVRAAHCNLSCSWCDAAYTWKGNVKFAELTTEQILEEIKFHYVVLTGGEPTIMPGFRDLLEGLGDHHITVETNGTQSPNDVDPDTLVDLWSVSPKLGSSGQIDALNPEALRDYAEIGRFMYDRLQWKFVIDTEQDYHDTFALLSNIRYAESVPVFLQPNGLCHSAEVWETGNLAERLITDGMSDQRKTVRINPHAGGHPRGYEFSLRTPYGDKYRWLIEYALEHPHSEYNVRVVPQIHKVAFGNRRGH